MPTPSFILFGKPEVERADEETSKIVEGNPQQGVWLYCEDAQTGSDFGIWECTAGKFDVKIDGYTEFCHILEGEAHITNLTDGTVNTVKAGDSFVMEAGLDTQWHVPKYIKKCFAISEVN